VLIKDKKAENQTKNEGVGFLGWLTFGQSVNPANSKGIQEYTRHSRG